MNPENHVLKLAALPHLWRAVTIKGKLSAVLNPTKCLTRPHSKKMNTNKSCFIHLLKIEFKFDNFGIRKLHDKPAFIQAFKLQLLEKQACYQKYK